MRAGCIIGGLIERKLVMEADLIVTVGLDAVELQPKPWPYTLPVLALSSVPSLDALVPADPEIIGDLKALLAGLAQWAPEGTNWGEKAGQGVPPGGPRRTQHAEHGLSPQRTMEVARACCRATPSPHAMPARADCWSCRNGNRTGRASSSPRTASAPWAMRCRAHWRRGSRYPDRPVVAFTGDGGFLMTIAELQTAQRENLPIIVWCSTIARSG